MHIDVEYKNTKHKIYPDNVVERIVSHELGHAVYGEIFDGDCRPTSLCFKSDNSALAFCEFENRRKKFTTPFKGISYLGGMFGELVYGGKTNPWGISSDFDLFISENREIYGGMYLGIPLIDEIDSWLYIDDDEKSFRASTINREMRGKFVLDCQDVFERLPNIWKLYCEFCNNINKDEFIRIVEKISKGKATTIGKIRLRGFLKEIINEN